MAGTGEANKKCKRCSMPIHWTRIAGFVMTTGAFVKDIFEVDGNRVTYCPQCGEVLSLKTLDNLEHESPTA